MLLCKKIKIEVSEQGAATLEFMQEKCRGLYNWWVMRLRNGERWPGWEQAKKTQQASRNRAFLASGLGTSSSHFAIRPCIWIRSKAIRLCFLRVARAAASVIL